jgi:hypothetical protein
MTRKTIRLLVTVEYLSDLCSGFAGDGLTVRCFVIINRRRSSSNIFIPVTNTLG